MQNKSTIGYLTKQYRIILKKCFYLNLAAMMVAGTICVSSANAADLTVADGATETKNLTDGEIYENITVETGGTLNITGDASDPELYKIVTTEKASEITDITIKGNLNITNSVLEAGNDMDSAPNNSNMLLDGATIDLTNSSMEANGNITITDTTIDARTTFENSKFGLWADKDITISGANTDITLNNGTYISAAENISISDATISIDGESFIGSYDETIPLNVTINSGDFTLTNNGEISTDGGVLTITGGTFNVSDRSGMLGKTTKISGVDTEINIDDGWTTAYESFTFSDGVINLSNNSGIGAEGVSSEDAGIITYPGGTVNLNSGTINVKTGSNNIIGATITSAATINIDAGATLQTVANYTENDATDAFTFGPPSTITNTGTINLSGTLIGDVEGDYSNPTAGVINFNSSTAKIDGKVDGANVAFNENITLSNAITEANEFDIYDEGGATVIGTSREHHLGNISVANGNTLTIDEMVQVNSFNFSEGNIVIVNNGIGPFGDDPGPKRIALFSYNGDITVSGGKISLSDYTDFGTYNGKLTISGGEISTKASVYENLDVVGGVIEMTAGKVNLDGNKMESDGNFSMTGGEFNLISETDFSSILAHDGNIDIADSAVVNMDSKNGGVATAYSTIEGYWAREAGEESGIATSYIKIAGDAVINVKNNTKAIISTDKREAEILGNAILNVEEGSLLTGGKYRNDDENADMSDYTTFFEDDRITFKMSENAEFNLKGTLDGNLNLAGGSLNLQTSSEFTTGNTITVDNGKTGNISAVNSDFDTVALPNLVLNGTSKLNLDFDADLTTGESDSFSFVSETGDGSIIIDDVNLLAGLANGATSKDITIFTGNNLSSLTVDVGSASISSGSYKLAYNNGKLTFSEATYDTLQEGYNANGTRSYVMTGNEVLTGAMSGSSFTINGNGNEILEGAADLSLTDTQTLTLNNVTANGNIVGTGAIKAGDTVNLKGDITANSLHGNVGSILHVDGDVNVNTITSGSVVSFDNDGQPDESTTGLVFKGQVDADTLTITNGAVDFTSDDKDVNIGNIVAKMVRFGDMTTNNSTKITFTGNIDSSYGLQMEGVDIVGDVDTGLIVVDSESSINGALEADEIALHSSTTGFTYKGSNNEISANIVNADKKTSSEGDDTFVIEGSGNTFTGTIGAKTSSNMIASIYNLNNIPNLVVNGATTFTGDIYADKISGSADITLAGANQVVDTNLNGTDFTGTLNFNSSTAKIDGKVDGANVAFNENITLSNAITEMTEFNIYDNDGVTPIKLYEHQLGNITIAAGKTLTIDEGVDSTGLDLSGKLVVDKVDFDIDDDVVFSTGEISIVSTEASEGEVDIFGSLTIDGENTKLTLDGEHLEDADIKANKGLTINDGIFEMNIAEIKAIGSKYTDNGNPIEVESDLNINGGTFNATDSRFVTNYDLNISGNDTVINFTSSSNSLFKSSGLMTYDQNYSDESNNPAEDGTITISGGTINYAENSSGFMFSENDVVVKGDAELNVKTGAKLTVASLKEDYDDDIIQEAPDPLTLTIADIAQETKGINLSETAVFNLKGTLDGHLNLAGGSLNLQTSSEFTTGNTITVDNGKTGNISAVNSDFDTVALPNLVLNGTSKLNLDFDADITTGESDSFSFASETGDGSIVIDEVNLLAGLANGATSKDITIFTGNNLSSLTVDVGSASISSGSYKLAYNNGKLTFAEATYNTLQEGYNANGTRSYAMTGDEVLTGAMSGSSFTINGNGNEILAGVDDLSLTDTQTLTLNNVTANGNIIGAGAIKAGDNVTLRGDVTANSLHGNVGSILHVDGDVNVDTITSDSETILGSDGQPDGDYTNLVFKGNVTADSLTAINSSIDFENDGKTITIDEVNAELIRFDYKGSDSTTSRMTFTGNIDTSFGVHMEAVDIIGNVDTGVVVASKGNSSVSANLTADEIVLYSREKSSFIIKGSDQTINANVFNIDRTDVSQGDTDTGDDAFVISGSGNTFTGDFGKSNSSYFTRPTDDFTTIPEIVVNGATTFTGDIYADKISGSADITLAGANQVVDTNLNGTDFTGTLNFKSDSASVDGDMTDMDIAFLANATLSNALKGANNSFTTFDIKNNSVVTYDKDITIGDLNVADGGVLAIGTNDVAGITTANFADGSTLQFQVSGKDAADYGSFTANTINITDGANLELILDTGALAKDEKATFDVLNGTTTGNFTLSTNARYEFVDNNDGTFDITGKATAADIVGDAGGDDNNAGTATAWDKALPADAPQSAKDVLDKLNELSQRVEDSKKYIEALTSLAPEANGANSSNVVEGAKQIFRAIANRFNGGGISKQSLPSGDQVLGESALWAQGLINSAELDVANGFESDTYGIAFGYENNVNEMVKLGFGYAYTNSEIDATGRTTDADTNTIIAYGEYKPSDWYVNGILSYSFGAYDENKDVGGVNVNADYDVNALALQAMTGYNFDNQGFIITPEAGLRYVRIEQDSYTDTAAQTIASKSDDVLTGVIGAKVSKAITLDNGMTLTPEAKIALTYDITEADSNTVVSLANGSSYTSNTEPLERFGQEIGFGLTANINENVDVNVGYEGKFRKDFTDHTGMLNIRYNF